ncbi:MAG: ABC transporter permease [Aerococcaceae bacterium]|nr:ABC transporter permease [Aerococcaceae bacterium]
MTDLTQLWRKRLRLFLKMLGKYSRLMLNDHVSIVLLGLLGFGSLFYRELLHDLQQVNLDTIRVPLILGMSVVAVGAYNIGTPIWLMEPSDVSYLFPQGRHFFAYWKKGRLLGLMMPLLLLFGVITLLAPFISLLNNWALNDIIAWGGGLILLRIVRDEWLFGRLIDMPLHYRIGYRVMTAVIITSSLLWQWPFLLIVASVLCLAPVFPLRQKGSVPFQAVIEQETKRQASFYKWVSFFADVPKTKAIVKRRQYLDWLLQREYNPSSYLYARLLLRHSTYSRIWLNSFIFVSVCLLFTKNTYYIIALGIISHWLTIVQCVPLAQLHHQHPMMRLYPQQTNRLLAVRRILNKLLSIQIAGYALIALAKLNLSLELAVVIICWLMSAELLKSMYLSNHNASTS